MKGCFYIFLFLLASLGSSAQKNTTVTGKIVDEDDRPVAGATISILNQNKATTTNDSGYFKLNVSPNKPFALLFSFVGYATQQRNFNMATGEQENITIKLKKKTSELETVTVTGQQGIRDPGSVKIDASTALLNPSPLGNIEGLLKTLVGSSNELTSQYNVRGGSFDENLIYVNDFEVFRPYLIRNGQQEGLSFINPELTSNVKFYVGGFAAKYGDKMSSVLDITYRKPKQFGGSAYIGLLEQGVHLEGTSTNKKFTYLIGARNRSNRNILSSQETKGNYIPSSGDLQALLTYQVAAKWQVDVLANISQSKFTLFPEESSQSSAVFSPLFTANFALNTYFSGREKDKYSTNFIGLSATNTVNKKLRLKYMLSRFENDEEENIDITGDYVFGERDFDRNSSSYGLITNPLGAGVFQNYSRNKLNIEVWNFSHKGSYSDSLSNHFIQWGIGAERQNVTDKLHEFEYNDSAGYSLPNNSGPFALSKFVSSTADLNINRFTGYVQDNIRFNDSADFILEAGVRFNYNDLNKEFLLSPRIGFSFIPKSWQKRVVVKGSVGMYNQPPFYRELRRYDGSLNEDLKSQKSIQASAGLDYNFKMFGRPARFSTEAYYKNMRDVVVYDIDNVRLRYSGNNNAKAYAAGIEGRLYGQIVKDAESWLSIGIMKTMENIDNDFYYKYKNASGEFITSTTQDQVVADSIKYSVGRVRRPTDRLITFGMFFQDYLSTNKNIKVYLNTIYGSNMPYNIPGNVRYRNALTIDPYIRVDLGLSALLLDMNKENRRSHSPFKNFESIWASLEVFNLIDRPNTSSYQLIKDFSNNIFTVPNRLTPRLLNFKIVARW